VRFSAPLTRELGNSAPKPYGKEEHGLRSFRQRHDKANTRAGIHMAEIERKLKDAELELTLKKREHFSKERLIGLYFLQKILKRYS
jgi:hypothetical protein